MIEIKLSKSISKDPPMFVNKYSDLLEVIAKLSFKHKRQVLYFRGQSQDYQNDKGNYTTLYPSIYRNTLSKEELKYKFLILNKCVKDLVNVCDEYNLEDLTNVKRRKHIAWSILQHYEMCETPLLDVTHSLRVACTFASMGSGAYGYIYVLGFPYITNRISINSEDELIIIRLLSISPPEAKSPYYQEGYLAGTPDVYDWYDVKSELDFKSRLVGKFMFKNDPTFWGEDFGPIKKEFLYPTKDVFQEIKGKVIESKDRSFLTGEMGEFFLRWNNLQKSLGKLSTYRVINNNLNPKIMHNYLEYYNFSNEYKKINNLRNYLRDSLIANYKLKIDKDKSKSIQDSIEKLELFNSIINMQETND